MSADSDRSRLLDSKLRAFVAAHFSAGGLEPVDFPAGAAAVSGDSAFLLLDVDPVTSFGPALVLASRVGGSEVHLLADSEVGVLARRASCFEPAPSVWEIAGTELRRAEPAPAPEAAPAPSTPELAELLVDADLEVVVEDAIVRGEINGLEVARIVHGRTTAGEPIDEPRLEVGVGQADRELTGMLHGGLSPTDQLARVAEIVRSHRQPGAERHPLNQLVPERWLRAVLVSHPERIGLASLRPVAPAIPRANLRDTATATAIGERADGTPVVVACSVGIDLGLVPAAADARLAIAPDADLLLAVPARDAHPVTVDLAARLVQPAEVVPVEGDWRA